jgi:hypothetical protein
MGLIPPPAETPVNGREACFFLAFLGRFQPTANRGLDGFDVERDALAAFKLLDALVHVADKLFAMPQQFDGPVEGLGSIVIDSRRDESFEELLIFWREIAAYGISPSLMTFKRV